MFALTLIIGHVFVIYLVMDVLVRYALTIMRLRKTHSYWAYRIGKLCHKLEHSGSIQVDPRDRVPFIANCIREFSKFVDVPVYSTRIKGTRIPMAGLYDYQKQRIHLDPYRISSGAYKRGLTSMHALTAWTLGLFIHEVRHWEQDQAGLLKGNGVDGITCSAEEYDINVLEVDAERTAYYAVRREFINYIKEVE